MNDTLVDSFNFVRLAHTPFPLPISHHLGTNLSLYNLSCILYPSLYNLLFSLSSPLYYTHAFFLPYSILLGILTYELLSFMSDISVSLCFTFSTLTIPYS